MEDSEVRTDISAIGAHLDLLQDQLRDTKPEVQAAFHRVVSHMAEVSLALADLEGMLRPPESAAPGRA